MKKTRTALIVAVLASLLAVLLAPTARAQTQTQAPKYQITQGTSNQTPMRTNSPIGPVDNHGTRVYCTTSHMSYDDPVVFPGMPAAAHLHTFWGNSDTDWSSTGQSLFETGNSSCEGGLNNRSAYWAPTVFDALDQAVLPETTFVYYKTFGGPDFDRSTIQVIPNGLEMLAHQRVEGSWVGDFRTDSIQQDRRAQLQVTVNFPVCVAVDSSGSPILSSANNTDHLAYGSPGDGDGTDCAASHPYRIPQVSYHLTYDIDPSTQWYLSSDTSAATQGESLHADYIAAWDVESMERLVQCNIESREHCEFGDDDGDRGQLPDRFDDLSGTALYRSSVELLANTDRTPFGSTLSKNHGETGAGDHTHGDDDTHGDHDDDDEPVDPPSNNGALTLKYNGDRPDSNGWVLFETGADAGTQQWISTDCRLTLVAAGLSQEAFVDYNAEIGQLPTVDVWRTCPDLVELIPDGASNSTGDSSAITLTASAEGTAGWVLFDGGDEAGTQQWVSRECLAQLVDAGIPFHLFEDYYAEVGSRPSVSNWNSCAELLALGE